MKKDVSILNPRAAAVNRRECALGLTAASEKRFDECGDARPRVVVSLHSIVRSPLRDRRPPSAAAGRDSFRFDWEFGREVRSELVPAKDFKKRMVVELDDAPHIIEHIIVQTPSARGAATLYKIKARNLKTRQRVERSFRGAETLAESSFERRPAQFLYQDGDAYHFMDSQSYDQFALNAEDLEEQAAFLTENMEGVELLVVNDEVIGIEIPDTVELAIVETAPGVRGNSATGRTKPAKLSTGFTLQVPEHLDEGTRVRVDTRTGEYLGRAN